VEQGEIVDNTTIEQAIYTALLKDESVKCTCDEVLRDNNIHQAEGHYHHCMLYQITRAIRIAQKYERNSIITSIGMWQLSDNFLKKEDYERLMRIVKKEE
jgi:hypothetical protein